MSCTECNEIQDNTQQSFYYRWKNANIEIRGCAKHAREIMGVLNDIQDKTFIKQSNVTESI